MNLHVPQTIEAQVEAAQLMAVQEHIVTAQSHRPVMGIVQDTLIGTYELTSKDTFLTQEEIMDWCMHIKRFDMPPPTIVYPRKLWTGKDAFSMLLPTSTSLGTPLKDPYIANGILIRGQLKKKTLGRSQRSLIHILFNDKGPKVTIDFMSDLQRGVANWFSTQGFSIGISDFLTPEETQTRISELYEETVQDIHAHVNAPEQWINRRLNQARDTMGRAALESISRDNRLLRIVQSGSKGSNVNILQIMACLGQQNIKGQRIPCHIAGRALPCFRAGTTNPEARGNVKNSFRTGLTPYGYFFHTIGGREGLVDTAVKTSESGYIQRQLVKSLEDITAHADMTVRDSSGKVIQFMYGDDGRDGTSLEFVSDGNERVATPCPVDRLTQNASIHQEDVVMDDMAVPRLLKALQDVPKVRRIVSNVLKDHSYASNAAEQGLERWERARIAAGEMVGVLAAQSLGEPVTQLTLNTFHFAGISAKNVTLGVPRFRELMGATKKQKTPCVTLTYATPQQAKAAAKTFHKRTLSDFVACHKHEKTRPDDIARILNANALDEYDHLLELDPIKMHEVGLELDDIVDKLETQQTSWKIIGRESRDLPPAVLVSYTGRRANEPIAQFMRTQIQGVGSIITGATHDGCEVYTDGSDLYKCRTLKDILHIDSNDPIDVLKSYGIEAARTVLLRELEAVMSFGGSYVNPRHLKLLVDWMTFDGQLTSANRHGARRRGGDLPIARATFEQPVEVFLDAALHNKTDILSGISEQLMFGCVPTCGTTLCEAIEDPECISKHQTETPIEEEDIFTTSMKRRSPPLVPPPRPPSHAPWEMPVMNPPPPRPPSHAPWEMPSARPPSHAPWEMPVMNPPPPRPPAHAPWEMPSARPPSHAPWEMPSARPPSHAPWEMPSARPPSHAPWEMPVKNPSRADTWNRNTLNERQPWAEAAYSPSSPQAAYSPSSPQAAYSPSSPQAAYSPSSPQAAYSPSSPQAAYSPSSPQAAYSPSSPQAAYSPSSPQAAYSPSSPQAGYSPSSPQAAYSPSSPQAAYSPSSPQAVYSPSSPQAAYSPSSSADPYNFVATKLTGKKRTLATIS